MRHSSRFILLTLGLVGASGILGCASDTTGPAPVDPAHLYYQLTLNHHAITMALTPPYDTLQLMATPQSAMETAVADTETASYTVLNGDTNVTVSRTGLLTAMAPDVGAQVVARLTIGNVTHTDTATINVNTVSSVPQLAALVLDPEPGDTARTTVFDGFNLTEVTQFPLLNVTALTANRDTINNINVHFTCTDPGMAGVLNLFYPSGFPIIFTSVSGTGSIPGHVLIVAEATVYGVSKTDSVQYTLGWPTAGSIAVTPSTPIGHLTPLGIFSPHDDTVAVGATVVWVNTLHDQPVDVVFDDSIAVQAADSAMFSNGFYNWAYTIPNQGGGNIAAFAPVDSTTPGSKYGLLADTLGVRARRFPVAGTYTYHSTLYNTTGVIHVLPEFQVP